MKMYFLNLNVMKSKPKLSFQIFQEDDKTTISASIPNSKLESYGKLIWGIIGSGTILIGSHFLTTPLPSLLPANPPTQTAQPTIGK